MGGKEAGKSYTMLGKDGGHGSTANAGLLPRIAAHLFGMLDSWKDEGEQQLMRAGGVACFLSVYAVSARDGTVADLLGQSDAERLVAKMPRPRLAHPLLPGRHGVVGVHEVVVDSFVDLDEILDEVARLRALGVHYDPVLDPHHLVYEIRYSKSEQAAGETVSATVTFAELLSPPPEPASLAAGAGAFHGFGLTAVRALSTAPPPAT